MWNWVKEKFNKFKKWLIVAFGIGAALAAPVIPVDMVWIGSYETIAFETADGDLETNEYAVNPEGSWYIRIVSKNEGQFIRTENPNDIIGKIEVKIKTMKTFDNQDCIGCNYYSEFINKEGKINRVSYAKQDYDSLRYISNYPQPKKSELTSIITGAIKPQKLMAAIAFDAATTNDCDECSSHSFSHTTAGSDRLMFFGETMEDTVDTDRDVTEFSYNAVVGTTIRRDNDDTTDITSEIWYLINPASGLNTVSVALAAPNNARAGVMSLTGVDQTNALDANNGTTGPNATSVSVSITTIADNAWVLDTVTLADSVPTLVVGAGQTERWNILGGGAVRSGGSHEGPKTPAGAVTMSWSCSGGTCTIADDWTLSAASFAPVAVSAAPPVPNDDEFWMWESWYPKLKLEKVVKL